MKFKRRSLVRLRSILRFGRCSLRGIFHLKFPFILPRGQPMISTLDSFLLCGGLYLRDRQHDSWNALNGGSTVLSSSEQAHYSSLNFLMMSSSPKHARQMSQHARSNACSRNNSSFSIMSKTCQAWHTPRRQVFKMGAS